MAAYATAADKPAGGFDLGQHYAKQEIELWPENWRAWVLFSEMSGQWRMAPMGGPIALDYTPLLMRMERLPWLETADWEDLYLDVRVLESAALEQMRNNG